jgi:hypothetical protein
MVMLRGWYGFMVAITLLYISGNGIAVANTEEFSIDEPGAIDTAGVKVYIDARQEDPKGDWNMTWDHPLMMKAASYAEARQQHPGLEPEGFLLDEANAGVIKALPMPDSDKTQADMHIAATVTANNQGGGYGSTGDQRSSFALMTKEQLGAVAIKIGEDVGTGALARAGAVSKGGEGQWIGLVEAGARRKSKFIHGEMIAQLGTLALENQTFSQGINRTRHQERYDELVAWAEAGGASMSYLKPVWMSDRGAFRLLASETLGADEAFIKLPMKLMMSQITSRNVKIRKTNGYVGAQLKESFESDERYGLALFLLHEWYKMKNGDGSKWGPLLQTLSVRQLSTATLQHMRNTQVLPILKEWAKKGPELEEFSRSARGPCNGALNMCQTKPKEKVHGGRFDKYMLQWAFDVVQQNAVRVAQKSTGRTFLALVPFVGMMDKRVDGHGGAALELDGSVTIRAGVRVEEHQVISIHASNYTDQEFFARYLALPVRSSTHTDAALSMLEVIHTSTRTRPANPNSLPLSSSPAWP